MKLKMNLQTVYFYDIYQVILYSMSQTPFVHICEPLKLIILLTL